MKKLDMTNVQEAGEFRRPEPGAYHCVITDVKDVEEKEYLKVEIDIAEGEFKGYYAQSRADHPDWDWSSVGRYVKSYKQAALPMFKRFCSAVSKSNGNYVFDGGAVNSDEKSLIGKHIGIILQGEEYYSNSGDVRIRLNIYSECPVDKIPDQKVPKLKALKEEPSSNFVNEGFTKAEEAEVPW